MNLELSPGGRRYGGLRSLVDHRDFGVRSFPYRFKSSIFPSSIDLEPTCGPIRDQGDEGSCTGHAGYAMRMQLANALQGNANKVVFSPADIYWLARKFDGTLDEGDCGSTGRSIVNVLLKSGACPESDDPYVAGDFNRSPSLQALTDGLKWRAGAYHSLTILEDMKSCLASGYGFIVSFVVYESFEGPAVASSGLMPVPTSDEQQLGGHEVYCCGYNDTVKCPGSTFSGALKFQNSWGKGWGQSGFFYMPYECVSRPDVFMDAFIQHLGPAWKN